MKKLLASTAFAALMVASGSASAIDLGVAVVAAPLCVVPNGGNTTQGFTTNAGGVVPGGGPSTLGNFPGSYCTGPAKLKLQSARGAITTGATAPVGAAPAGFANHVKYSATATWATLVANVNANNTAAALAPDIQGPVGAANSTLDVQYTVTGTVDPLLAGTYSDTMSVQIIPN